MDLVIEKAASKVFGVADMAIERIVDRFIP
jgi:hypothetical protein